MKSSIGLGSRAGSPRARQIQWRGILEPAYEPVADLDVGWRPTSDRSCRSYQECCRKEDTILSLMGDSLPVACHPSLAEGERRMAA